MPIVKSPLFDENLLGWVGGTFAFHRVHRIVSLELSRCLAALTGQSFAYAGVWKALKRDVFNPKLQH